MTENVIRIQNCNNIVSGELTIQSGKLNILFGKNGTGKSTIADALKLKVTEDAFDSLIPYATTDQALSPDIQGVSFSSCAVFNEEYIKSYVFQTDSLLKSAFEVFVRSSGYDEAKKNIDDALQNLKTTISDKHEIVALREQTEILIQKIKLTNSNVISKTGGIKEVLKGKGAYFNPPEELDSLKPFFESDTVATWAAWRQQGFENYGAQGLCPYCAETDTENTTIINKAFSESFSKASIESASAIIAALREISLYIDTERVKNLVSLFGVKDEFEALETQLKKLSAEAHYLHGRLAAITAFNGFTVNRDNLDVLETILGEFKINQEVIDCFFTGILTKEVATSINTEVDALLKTIGELKGEIGKLNRYIQATINNRENDINDFLKIAGFRYKFSIEVEDESRTKALLKFVKPNGDLADLKSADDHLSWGEKHAFALIMFMFDVISKNIDLVILDDPISSFDGDKKYAIINRLFKTGDRENSLYQRTVLMLTHDFEPIIDYIQVGGRHHPSSIKAAYFENIAGQIRCTEINKNTDLLSSVVLFKELANDESIDIAARIGCLRKFIEHQHKVPRDESEAYNILSSLVHGRPRPTLDNEGNDELSEAQVIAGTAVIQEYIPSFDYETALAHFETAELISRYETEASPYIKLLILRAYIENSPEARDRLKVSNDVLRKYIDETYHIENDYLYSLDVRRFNVVSSNYIIDADTFVASEKTLLSEPGNEIAQNANQGNNNGLI